MTKNEKRDVTRILALAKRGASKASSAPPMDETQARLDQCAAIFTQIAAIAKPMDARTGRRDPSIRKSAKKKRAGSGK